MRLVIIFLAIVELAYAKPLRILVIDAWMNYEHPALKPFVDLGFQNQYGLIAINDDVKKWQLEFLNPKYYTRQVIALNSDRIERYERLTGVSLSKDMTLVEQLRTHIYKFLHSEMTNSDSRKTKEKYLRSIHSISTIHHGTQVGYLATLGLDPEKVRLVHKAIRACCGSLVKRNNGDEEFTRNERLEINAQHQLLYELLKNNRIRVVNISIDDLRGNRPVITHTIRPMIKAFPEILFVVAAGNDRIEVLEHEGLPKCPNVIFVGSMVDRGQLWSEYSNFSKQWVDLAAWGEFVPIPMTEGGFSIESGTSFAAPWVTGKLAEIFSKNPELPALEAKKILFEQYIGRNQFLEKYVVEGRYLLVDPDLQALLHNQYRAQSLYTHCTHALKSWK